jgi:glycosyltransferase involved in cell wall biosynthesis
LTLETAAERLTKSDRAPGDGRKIDVSVIVPVADRVDDVAQLYQAFAEPLEQMGREFEFVFVLDGGGDGVASRLNELAREDRRVRAYGFVQSFGEAAALRAGIEHSSGAVIVTLPSCFQVSPTGMREVLEELEKGADVVVCYRSPRADGIVNRLQHKVFHWILRVLTGYSFKDLACGLRGMRREVAAALPLYSGLDRYLPALAQLEGYSVREIPVAQHPLDARTRVYSPLEYFRQSLDLIAFFFMAKFTDNPLRFFGAVGSALGISGIAIGTVLVIQRLGGQGIANRPLLLLSVLLVALGVQIVSLGLIGEIIVYQRRPGRSLYRVRRIV